MRIMANEPTTTPSFSMESFVEYHGNALVLSLESFDEFFAKTKDHLTSLGKVLTMSGEDKAVTEALSNRFETTTKANKVKLNDFRHAIISKPEGFKGFYIDYLRALIEVSEEVAESTHRSLSALKIGVAGFINEYSDGQADNFYGYHYFKKEKKIIEDAKKTIGGFFKAPGKVKTNPDEVIKGMADIPLLYQTLEQLSTKLNKESVKKVDKETESVTVLIDVLIDQNLQSGILLKNSETKKEMVQAIEQTAQSVEFYCALYAHLLFFCTAFKSLTDALNAQPNS